jgi:predicted RNase H-like HicB family nuclease
MRLAVISRYLAEALHRAQYRTVDDGLFCATVPGLPGVIATGATLESCRDQLADVIEEWLLVRVARGLKIPKIGTATVQVKRAS